MEQYSGDREAEAVVLFDKGETSFLIDEASGELNVEYKRTRRIKIFKKSAFSRSNISIRYYNPGSDEDWRIYDIKAFSHSMENNVLEKRELDPSAIFEEKNNDKFRTKKFTIPNIKEGSIFEYQYSIEIPNSIDIPDWVFQNDIPTRYSEYQVSIIPFYEYTYILQGKSGFNIKESKKGKHKRLYAKIDFVDMIHRFGLKNLPAFKDDSYITSVRDYIVKMDWQLATIHYPGGGKKDVLNTWPKLSNELINHSYYGKYISSSERAFKKISSQLSLTNLSPLEKAKSITSYVKSNYQWDGP